MVYAEAQLVLHSDYNTTTGSESSWTPANNPESKGGIQKYPTDIHVYILILCWMKGF